MAGHTWSSDTCSTAGGAAIAATWSTGSTWLSDRNRGGGKTTTAISLGEANTRVRDHADLYTLTGRHEFAYSSVRFALDATAVYRGVSLCSLSAVVGEIATMRQSAYVAFRRRLGSDGEHLPTDFADVVAAVAAFADPLVRGLTVDAAWSPTERQWK